jgi:hypothetical protein
MLRGPELNRLSEYLPQTVSRQILYFSFGGAGDGMWSLAHARQAFCYCAISQPQQR